MSDNILDITSRQQFRRWLQANAATASECWVATKRGKPNGEGFWYLDAVEEALCFGWIDSTQKLIDGVRMQRFSPRRKNSVWTELNKERVRRLIRLGLMTDMGLAVLPDMRPEAFCVDEDIVAALQEADAYETFLSFPSLYRRVRAYNVAFYKHRDHAAYQKALRHLVAETKQGRMYGEWNDYGRLLQE